MPRRGIGPHLRYEPSTYKDGKLQRRGAWLIADGKNSKRTGCAEAEREQAEKQLTAYIAAKHKAPTGKRHPSEILITEVLNYYQTNRVADWREDLKGECIQRLDKLADFFEPYTLSNLNGTLCRLYVTWRTSQTVKSSGCRPRLVSPATARRELQDLSAAVVFHLKEGQCSEVVGVAVPKKSGNTSRKAWLERGEVALLVWAAWTAKQVMRDGVTKRRVGKHIARFILVAFYTGTRHEAICRAAFTRAIGRGYIDVERGVFFRQPEGIEENKKQQPPVRLPGKLLWHIRRWHRLGISTHAVVEWNGKPVLSVRKGFAAAVAASNLEAIVKERFARDGIKIGNITPHILRHTAATRLMAKGEDVAVAAGFLGMSEQTLWDVYGHHHPDFQKGVAERAGSK